jgi:hypothetical protein
VQSLAAIEFSLIYTTRYFCDLARLDRLEDRETRGHVRQQLLQGNRFGAENDQRDVSAGEILPVPEALIHGHQHLENRRIPRRLEALRFCCTSWSGK